MLAVSDLTDLDAIVDTDRYPVDTDRYPIDCGEDRSAIARRDTVVAEARASLAARGVAALDGFLRTEAIDRVAADAIGNVHRANLQDSAGTAYLTAPDDSFPTGHPRRNVQRSRTHILAYDLVPPDNPVRQLFESDLMTAFLAEVLDRNPLHRMADPLGALNLTVMEEDHVQGWHYDSTDFVVSIAIQSSEGGGEFECARDIRDANDEHYDDVARVLDGRADDLVRVYPMTPGTLMVFMGRYSLHRVAPITGSTPRVVALLGYDTRPDTNSSDGLKLARYGRTQAFA